MALWRGWLPSVIGVIPYVGLNFATYETSKEIVLRHYGAPPPACHRGLSQGAHNCSALRQHAAFGQRVGDKSSCSSRLIP